MKIKVISLSTPTKRRGSIREQLCGLGAPFEFSDAITVRDASRHVHHYDEREFFLNCGHAATATEIACYASHLSLWQRCADGEDPYLILEDDAELDSSFLAGLLVVAAQIQRRGLIRVSLPYVNSSLMVDDLGQFKIQYCRRVPLLALGYAVSPGAAARLARAAKIVEEPVDKYMQRFWRHGQPVYAMCPPIVHLAPIASESDIGERTRPKYGLSAWLRRSVRKTQNAVARARFNMMYNPELSHGG
ncbi:MAG: glycosyltransferase family 25 protein [Gammaproteobacteria bacterium]|nr:glycosyltransferase family 25 protein [Gammaproteobacteria bacterium]